MQSHYNVHRFSTLAAAAALIACFSACNKSDSPTAPPGNPNRMLTLTAPAGGETFHVGDVMHVTWTTKNTATDQVDAVDVDFSPDGGMTWGPMSTASISDQDATRWENFSWTVPDSLTIPSKSKVALAGCATCVVRVEQYSTHDSLKISVSKPFMVVAK